MIELRLPSHFPVRATEWMLATIKATWGLLLLLPFDVFANPSMAAMRQIASQHTWGAIGFSAGSIHLVALYVNGTRRKSPHVRAMCSGIGTLFWFEVTLGVFGAGTPTTGWAVYPWFFVFSVYNVVRAMRDARLSDEQARGSIGGGYE